MAAILADDIFKCIFLNENDKTLIQISLKFIPDCPVDNNPALVKIMAWRQIGDKPLSEPMLTRFTDAYMHHKGKISWEQHLMIGQLLLIRYINLINKPTRIDWNWTGTGLIFAKSSGIWIQGWF